MSSDNSSDTHSILQPLNPVAESPSFSAPSTSTSSLPLTLVTGATGHVGNNLVRALLRRGKERVRVLVRHTSNIECLGDIDVEIVYGDLRIPSTLDTAMIGVDYMYHVAAFVSIRYGDRDELYETNILGTRYIMQAALQHAVKRVVYTSSFGAVRCDAPSSSNESSVFNPYQETTDYECSKGFSEGQVWQIAAQGLDVVTVNPSGIVGPWDWRPSMLGNTLLDYAHGKLKVIPSGAMFDFVSMDDVVQGHLLAMKKGLKGHRYLLTGEQVSFDTWMEHLFKLTGKPKPAFKIPPVVLSTISIFKDWIERTFFPEIIPRFTQNSIRLLTSGKHGDRSKAVTELGVKPTPIEISIERQLKWFVSKGMIPENAYIPSGKDLGKNSDEFPIEKKTVKT